jgi:hypothetical protein
MLNGIAGDDIELSLERHRELHLVWLDLKDGLYGQTINDLSLENAGRLRQSILSHGMQVDCLSSSIGYSNVEAGEAEFRARHWPVLEHVLRVAEILRPRKVRLLAPILAAKRPGENAMARAEREFPWIFALFSEMASRIHAAGFSVGIENEVNGCVLASVADVLRFFELANQDRRAHCIFDVQNLWQMGTFPSLDGYRELRPIIGALHLKGGIADRYGVLNEASPLEIASWPVVEIIGAVVKDEVAPIMCLNPSHGRRPSDYDDWKVVKRDIAFLRRSFPEIE